MRLAAGSKACRRNRHVSKPLRLLDRSRNMLARATFTNRVNIALSADSVTRFALRRDKHMHAKEYKKIPRRPCWKAPGNKEDERDTSIIGHAK
jgi:hypothetical protein